MLSLGTFFVCQIGTGPSNDKAQSEYSPSSVSEASLLLELELDLAGLLCRLKRNSFVKDFPMLVRSSGPHPKSRDGPLVDWDHPQVG